MNYSYDANGRMTFAETSAHGNQQTSVYDAGGQRVQTTVNSVTRTMVYDIFDQDVADYKGSNLERENIYRGGQLIATQDATTRNNVAAAGAGATASAQNYTQDGVYPGHHFQPSYAIDGLHFINPPWGDNYWRDEHGLSSWFQVDFNGSKTIDEIDVFTVADSATYFSDPTPTETFSQYGATSFTVQYWNGSAWTTVSGGSITGNNLVWKKLTFSAVTTSKIRITVNAAIDGVARLTEVEAWGTPASGLGPINYVLSDVQGSARARMNNSGVGTSSIISRHDYLPFGEEISSGTGLRTSTQGYGAADTNRWKYGLTERDDSTGLDHTWWRKYDNTSGRWTSPDPYRGSITVRNPQSSNLYSYTQNDPVNLVDPSGLLMVCFWNEVQGDGYTDLDFEGCDDLGGGSLIVPGIRASREPRAVLQQKGPCDHSKEAIRAGAHQVVKTIPGASLGLQDGQLSIKFAGSYDQTLKQLEQAGYYSGILASNPIDHPGGTEFRTWGSPGFHFKLVYPTYSIQMNPGNDLIPIRAIPGKAPAVATDLHIDCNNPVGAGLGDTLRHGRDFVTGHTPWWVYPIVTTPRIF